MLRKLFRPLSFSPSVEIQNLTWVVVISSPNSTSTCRTVKNSPTKSVSMNRIKAKWYKLITSIRQHAYACEFDCRFLQISSSTMCVGRLSRSKLYNILHEFVQLYVVVSYLNNFCAKKVVSVSLGTSSCLRALPVCNLPRRLHSKLECTIEVVNFCFLTWQTCVHYLTRLYSRVFCCVG